ncbi:hypothetical protein AWC38_SpisGene18250 [Stylophora pistillata]|uniref:Uncharacterized protein n=1 Tax=Stylophora pistillata TaxID=50429 RepID=A0A2B4RM52_STYPI|nr:hypothetical protein AWC38_SpisGene18250 [Stylophora pistillata]
MAVFNILAEDRHSFEYQYTLALCNGKEDYEELKECLGEMFKEIEAVKSEGIAGRLEVLGPCLWAEFSLLKIFCIWCFCTKDKINDLDVEEWPSERDLADGDRLAKKSTTDGRKGCKQPPLLKIPFPFVVLDTLHMFLRIMVRLFHQVIEAVANKECEEVLTAEMATIKVEFKFFEEFNQLAEKYERKWTALEANNYKLH